MGDLKTWAIGVVAAALAITISEMILPDGGVKKTAKVAFSLVLILVVLSPVVNIVRQPDFEIYKAVQEAQNRFQNKTTNDSKTQQEDYYATILVEYERKLDAYIKNEAKSYGGICKNARLLINRDSKSEKFGFVEMIELDVSGGDVLGLQKALSKTFVIKAEMVKVRVVN